MIERGCTMHNTVTRRVTFDPRKKNKFRIRIDGVLQEGREGIGTRAQLIALVSQLAAGGRTVVVGPGSSGQSPRKAPKGTPKHPSKYRAKHR